MADYLKPIGFWSYTSSDDAGARGRLSRLRLLLAHALQLRIGREPKVYIFQDVAAIPHGTDWSKQIDKAIDEASFFIPIVTPAFLQSEMCCREVVHFRERETKLGRNDLIFPLHYIDIDDVDANSRHAVRDPRVLALLRQRQWIDFRSLRLRSTKSQAFETKLDQFALSIRNALAAVHPPPVPDQGAGPHFMLDEAGVIRFAPPDALDQDGNNIALLRSLHPRLCELARSLASAFARTNSHRHLAACVDSYRQLIDQTLDAVDFGRLYAEGVILKNTQVADAADKEEPDLDLEPKSTLNSLLQLHGTFVAATRDGLTALAHEERYQRRPEEELKYRSAAVSFAEGLQNEPAVIDKAAATSVLEAARQIDQGPNPERSGVVATGVLRNAAIVAMVGATVATLPVAAGSALGGSGTVAGAAVALLGTEALIRSKPFAEVAHSITSRLNHLSEAELRQDLEAVARTLHAQLQFVRKVGPALRGLAGGRDAFSWLHKSLDWIEHASAGVGQAPTMPPEAAPPASPSPPVVPPAIDVRPGRPEMVLIPAGSFVMGVPEKESRREKTEKFDERARPLHAVTIARPFRLGKFPVTRSEYAAFVEDSGYDKDGGKWREPGFAQTDRDPVVNVSAEDAEAYAVWLNQVAGPGWRLPSEAEWEYAARAGNTTARFWGNSFRQALRYAHVQARKQGTAPVDGRLPNGFGLHDMLGNVWEWTADPWHDSYEGAPDDGSAWTTGSSDARRVLRGGAWNFYPRLVRVGDRGVNVPGVRTGNAGFRVARTLFGPAS